MHVAKEKNYLMNRILLNAPFTFHIRGTVGILREKKKSIYFESALKRPRDDEDTVLETSAPNSRLFISRHLAAAFAVIRYVRPTSIDI